VIRFDCVTTSGYKNNIGKLVITYCTLPNHNLRRAENFVPLQAAAAALVRVSGDSHVALPKGKASNLAAVVRR
jgi:uncharacterized protein (UPF0548 family)